MIARRVAGAALIATTLVTALGLPQPAGAQAQARLDLVAQTTFVGDDPAVIDVRVLGAPAGATLRARLHEAVTTRSGLAASIAGRPPTAVIGEWPVPNIDEARVGSGNVISLQVPDNEIGLLLRRPTDAGPHPLIIDLLDGDEVLDTLVTHLLVVPPRTTRQLTVALVLDLGVPLSIIPDGTSAPDEAALDRAVGLAEVLAARVELPVTVRLTPETFDALSDAGSEGSLALLRAAAVGNSVLLSPWVDGDAEAWRRGGRSDIVSELFTRGREVLGSVALAEPSAVVALNDTATPATLAMLAAEPIGATGFILGDGVTNVPEEMEGPLVVADSDGVTHPAVLPDRFLANLVTGPDPELAVHDTLAELLRMALTGNAGPAGVVIAPDGIDLFALDLLLDGLDRPSPLVPGTIESVLAIPFVPRASGQPVEARLVPATPEDLTAHIAARNELEPQLAAYTSMVTDAPDPAELLRTILLASTSQAAAGNRSAYLDTVRQQVGAGLEGVALIDSGRITITARHADLPILIHNGQSAPISVALTLSAEKVDFPGGDRRLMVLDPGDNALLVEVLALASGDSVINLTIESPEGGVELAVGVVRLRSTAISGLGLLISVIALTVLLSWWVKSVRHGRRPSEDAPDIVAAAPDQPGHEPGEGHPTAEDHETAEGAT